MLEFAILGLLSEAPMHGYELRKRLGDLVGGLRAFSYGSLYPTLRRMQSRGWIAQDEPLPGDEGAPALSGKRARIVYALTPDGKERFAELLGDASPAAYDDEQFGVHLAFFAQTKADDRLRILQGRRRRVEERRDGMHSSLRRTAARLDRYTRELHEHGLEAADREVRWLNELIASETETSTPEGADQPHGRHATPTD